MTDTNWTKSANAFAKELKDLMKKHGVSNLYSHVGPQGANAIGIGFATEHNGDAFIMNYRLGNVFNLYAAEISELSNTFNEL